MTAARSSSVEFKFRFELPLYNVVVINCSGGRYIINTWDPGGSTASASQQPERTLHSKLRRTIVNLLAYSAPAL